MNVLSPLPAILCTCLLGLLPAAAQEKKKPEAGRHVRFLAVGELPPFRQEIRDDVRHELEPPPGSIPPREVLLGFGEKDEEQQAATLSLGRISNPLKVPAGGGPLLLKRQNDGQDAEPWLNITRPESGDFLVVLWRDPKVKTWGKASALVLPEDAITMPAGTWRVVNISTTAVGVTLAGEKLLLEAGKSFRRLLPAGQESTLEVFLQDVTGKPKRLYSSAILQNPGERGLVLIYLADGVASRRPVKVSIQREPVPVVEPPGKNQGPVRQ